MGRGYLLVLVLASSPAAGQVISSDTSIGFVEGGPRGGFVDNPLKRYPTPYPTTPWFGLGSPQVPSAGNASAASPIKRFALPFDEFQALIEGEPFVNPRAQQLDDVRALIGR